jgi:hypothetical protein
MTALSLIFDVIARDKATRTLDAVGTAAEKTGKKVEKSSSSAGKAFGLLGKTFAASSAGALGPLQELTDKMAIFENATESSTSKAGGRLLGIGLAATAAGSFLESLHSREQAAQQQLQTSIESTGKSYEDYAGQVDKAVKSGETFGNQASTTIDALNRLVITTHSPAEAFKGLAVAIDVAAVKHIPLAKAAEIVGLTFNGSTRAGKQFGLQLENVTGAAKGLTTAQHASATANTSAKTAQQAYNEKLDIWNNTANKTRAGAYALANAHQRMVDAQEKAKAASERLKAAQDKANSATDAGARNVDKLATVVKGQGSAAADTFTGHLKAMGAKLEDILGANGKVGGLLVTGGVVASGLGALASAGLFSKIGSNLGSLGRKFGLLRDVEVATSAEGAAAVEASAAKASAALVAEGDVAIATAGKFKLAVAGIVGVAATLGPGLFPDLKSSFDGIPLHGLTKGQFEEFANLQHHGDVNKLSTTDLSAIATYLSQAKSLDKTMQHVKDIVDGTLSLRNPKQTVLTDAQQLARDTASDNPNVASRAQATVAALAAAKAKHTGAGTDNGDAYLKALLAALAGDQATKKLNDAATAQAQSVVDAITKRFEAAKSHLQAVVQQSLALRQSVTSALQQGSSLGDIFSGPNLNANGAFGEQHDFGRMKAFLQKRVALMRKFVLELRALTKQGLDPSLIAQVAQLGPDAGEKVASGLLSGGPSGIGQINGLERQIASLANSTGKAVADDRFAKQIAADRANTSVLQRELQTANGWLKRLATGGSAAPALRTSASHTGV